MFGSDVVATYKGVAIERNGFGEYEFTMNGAEFCGFRSLARAKDAIQGFVQPTPAEHGYGEDSDCLCGRNFSKVRGLREHITKARAS